MTSPMTSPMKATVTQVPFGCFSIEGLLFDDGQFGVAVPQIANVFPTFQDDQNQAAKKLKRLMGEGFKTTKIKTEFNRKITLAVTLPDFERVLLKLYKQGDIVASNMVDDLVGLSLNQLFSDAFGVATTVESRQRFLVDKQLARQLGKVERRMFTKMLTSTF